MPTRDRARPPVRGERDRGASAVEYGLMVAAIAAVMVGVVMGLGTLLRSTLGVTSSCIAAAGCGPDRQALGSTRTGTGTTSGSTGTPSSSGGTAGYGPATGTPAGSAGGSTDPTTPPPSSTGTGTGGGSGTGTEPLAPARMGSAVADAAVGAASLVGLVTGP